MRRGFSLPVAWAAASAVAGRAGAAAPTPPDRATTPADGSPSPPPDEEADDHDSQQHDDERPECRDPPEEADQPPDLMPDEQADDPVRDTTAAEGHVMSAGQPCGRRPNDMILEHTSRCHQPASARYAPDSRCLHSMVAKISRRCTFAPELSRIARTLDVKSRPAAAWRAQGELSGAGGGASYNY
jgi:hypothetical protein